jgi:murein DD-endopeptidase MepM/ murein hydrolase activator NlpD
MTKNSASNPLPRRDDEVIENHAEEQKNVQTGWQQIWGRLLKLGLGETALHVITGVFAVVLILVVVWIMSSYFLKEKTDDSNLGLVSATTQTTVIPSVAEVNSSTALESDFSISRLAQIHTNFPSHPRDSITTYTVQKGDTIFGIADKFGLKPETILISNRYTLSGLPENMQPGTVLQIPPIDGVIHRWVTSEGLNSVAGYYGVDPQVIVDWPGNNLDPATLGDFSLPNIAAGTVIFIPGGYKEVEDMLPQVTRDSPATATSYGEGYCGEVTGRSGTGTFMWPTTATYLSGYDYSSIHHGIDIAGQIGNPIFASDSGVVVYAGANANGYGNLIILDHDNGWQTVYGHLSAIYVNCGASVEQGDTIGALGSTGNSTGPHLHFEIRKDTGYVNPWNYVHP